MFRTATFAVLYLSLGFAIAQPPAQAPAVTMDDIKKAWRERQDKVRSLKLGWKQKLTYTKSSLDTTYLTATGERPTTPHPPHDVILNGSGELTLDQHGHYSFESDALCWSFVTNKQEVRRSQTVFDGKQHTVYEKTPTPQGKQVAYVAPPSSGSTELHQVTYYPIWWFFRGADPGLTQSILDNCVLTGRSVVRNNRKCVELEFSQRTTATTQRFYLANDGSFAPVTMTLTRNNIQTLQLDIFYVEDRVLTTRPASWRYVAVGLDGKVRESVDVTVNDCEVNATLNATAFEVGYTPGTVVTEQLQGGKVAQSVVLEDGSRSERIVSDRLTPLDQVVAVQPSKWGWGYPLLIFLGTATLFVIASVRIVRFRLQRGAKQSS